MSDMTPAQTEAADEETIQIEYGGDVYTVPATADEWDIDVLQLFQSGRSVDALAAVMGAKQFQAFKTKHRKAKYLDEFSDLLSVRYGFKSAGE